MGYLDDLADVCRRTGYPVIEVESWQRRARSGSGGDSTGGYQAGHPNHVIIHHTASGPSSDGWPDVNYCCYGSGDAPVGNLYLSRAGEVYVMAGGASNTNGSGSDPCGVTPVDSMNSQSIAIEAGNNGIGEAWPDPQQDCYVKLCKELCDAYGIPSGRVHSHFEWAPGRKIDPAGQSKYATGSAMWNMDQFRGDVFLAQVAGGGGTPPPAYASGIDVSKWQAQIDWPQVQAAGYTWVAARTWDRDKHQVDETFVRNRDGMAFARWRLLYYWLEPGRVAEGVDEFFQAIGELRPGEGVMLDAEEDGIDEDQCVQWLEAVEAVTGIPSSVYTGAYAAGGTLWRSTRIFNGQRARILPAYTSEEEARGHADGIAWDAWQYTDSGRVPGIEPNCDLDRIDNGDAFTRCTLQPAQEDDDLTPDQARQLDELHRYLILPMPGNTDPNGVEMAVNWTTVYGYRVGQDIQRRLWAIEDALSIPHPMGAAAPEAPPDEAPAEVPPPPQESRGRWRG